MTRREDEVDNNPRNAALHGRIQTTLMRRYDTPVMNNVYRADYVECLVAFTLGTDWWLRRCCVIRARDEPGREAHPPQYTRSDRGIPSSAIRFSTAYLIAASTFWFLTVRAERLTPSIALYRETAFSATLWRVQPFDFRHS